MQNKKTSNKPTGFLTDSYSRSCLLDRNGKWVRHSHPRVMHVLILMSILQISCKELYSYNLMVSADFYFFYFLFFLDDRGDYKLRRVNNMSFRNEKKCWFVIRLSVRDKYIWGALPFPVLVTITNVKYFLPYSFRL